MAIHNEPGRGRKLCVNCRKYVGVRSRTCENCSSVFSSSISVVKVKPTVTVKVSNAVPNLTPEVAKVTENTEKSRIGRINYLKGELIRELRNSSRGYSASVLKEMSDIVLAEWE